MPAAKKAEKPGNDGRMKYNDDGELYFDIDLGDEKEEDTEDDSDEVDVDLDEDEDESDEEESEDDVEDDSEEEEEDSEDEDEEEEDSSVSRRKSKKKSTEVTSVSKRIEAIESAITKLPEMIAQGIATAIGNNKKKSEEEDEDEFAGVDMSEPKTVAKMMKKIIKEEIEAELKPVKEDTKLNRVRRDFEALYAEEGEKFKKAAPLVAKLMGAVPGLSVRDAYAQIKAMTPKVKMTKTQVKKKIRRQEVDADTETIGRGKQKSRESKGSLKDTIMESLQELRSNSRD